jgi:hypothetical protein
MHPNVAGAPINSALYLFCVFVAGLVTGHTVAWQLSLAAMGVAFISHVAQITAARATPGCRWLVLPG